LHKKKEKKEKKEKKGKANDKRGTIRRKGAVIVYKMQLKLKSRQEKTSLVHGNTSKRQRKKTGPDERQRDWTEKKE